MKTTIYFPGGKISFGHDVGVSDQSYHISARFRVSSLSRELHGYDL